MDTDSDGMRTGARRDAGQREDAGGEKVVAESLEWLDPARLSFQWHGGADPVRLTIEGDRSVLRLRAAQAFPLTDPDRLIQLFAVDPSDPIGIVADIAALDPLGRRAIAECIRRDRILPEVRRILDVEERRNMVRWIVETDRGVTAFDMDKVYKNVSRQPAGDVVLTDVMKNRYHVDLEVLDDASRERLERYG